MPRAPNSSPAEILVNTLKLIAEHGIGGVTLDMVADTSRVSKATIYKHWRNRDELIFGALSYFEFPTEIPDTGTISQDLRIVINNLVTFLNKPDGGRVYSSYVNVSAHDAKFDEFRNNLTARAYVPYETVLQRAIDRGEIALPVEMRLAIDMLVAPFVYQRVATSSPVRATDVGPVIRLFLLACLNPDH